MDETLIHCHTGGKACDVELTMDFDGKKCQVIISKKTNKFSRLKLISDHS